MFRQNIVGGAWGLRATGCSRRRQRHYFVMRCRLNSRTRWPTHMVRQLVQGSGASVRITRCTCEVEPGLATRAIHMSTKPTASARWPQLVHDALRAKGGCSTGAHGGVPRVGHDKRAHAPLENRKVAQRISNMCRVWAGDAAAISARHSSPNDMACNPPGPGSNIAFTGVLPVAREVHPTFVALNSCRVVDGCRAR